MSAKFDEEAHNGSISIVFTRSKRDGHTHEHTDGTTAALPYPLRNALRGDKKWSKFQNDLMNILGDMAS